MASPTRLTGIELIDCAKANAKQGLQFASQQCGYGDDLQGFQQELQHACAQIGVGIDDLRSLITEPEGNQIAPDTFGQL